jgi:hypothetical protein
MKLSTSIALRGPVGQYRLLGSLAMAGALCYVVVAFVLIMQEGSAYPPAVELLGMLWALGCICGLFGIVVLGAAGKNFLGRIAVGLAMLFYAIAAVDALLIALEVYPGMESPVFAISRLGTLVAMLLVGIATLLARRWAGWRKFAPFAIPLAMPMAMLVGTVTGAQLPIPLFIALAWFLIGYAVWSTPEP